MEPKIDWMRLILELGWPRTSSPLISILYVEKNLKASWWNQYWEYEEIVNTSQEQTYSQLLDYYKRSSKDFILDKETPSKQFNFQRGSAIVSALGLGSERRCKHLVEIDLSPSVNGKTKVSWSINLKIFGFQIGKNSIVEECKEVVQKLA